MISLDEALEIRDISCRRKVRYRCKAKASQDTVVTKKGGHHYHCPFCAGHHVSGGPASIETLEQIAQAIRVLAQEGAA